MYGITNEDYLKSLGPENFLGNLIITKNQSLKEMCSTGKSGSFFYFSYDSKFVLKTISYDEFELFKSILEDYYTHMHKNEDTLMQRFYGLHMMIFNGIKMHFVVMNNVFDTNLKVHLKYDLKGSSYQRLSRKRKEVNYDDYDFNVPMKDIDFKDRKETIDLLADEKEKLIAEIKKDSQFLAEHNINDYSFLIGINVPELNNKASQDQNIMRMLSKSGADNPRGDKMKSQKGLLRLPFYQDNFGGILSKDGNKIYFFGIIDIFTQYGGKKKVEHFFKSMTQGVGISCQPPHCYAERFRQFIQAILSTKEVTISNGMVHEG